MQRIKSLKRALSKLIKKTKGLICSLAHVLFGYFCGVLTLYAPFYAILGSLIFIFYELDEDYYLNDKAYKDIREFLVGFFLAGLEILLGLH